MDLQVFKAFKPIQDITGAITRASTISFDAFGYSFTARIEKIQKEDDTERYSFFGTCWDDDKPEAMLTLVGTRHDGRFCILTISDPEHSGIHFRTHQTNASSHPGAISCLH